MVRDVVTIHIAILVVVPRLLHMHLVMEACTEFADANSPILVFVQLGECLAVQVGWSLHQVGEIGVGDEGILVLV